MGGYLPHINSCWCLTPLVRRVTRVDQRWTARRRLDRVGSSDGSAVRRLYRCLIGRSVEILLSMEMPLQP
jgi:hypothetical protein